ncbi:MAG: type II toxin-antitoxin system HipA family toxin [Deltaproteobacteria bacterium]|nr:type II toxin-antitoxin system HipA family toxin [Deltaproteobacteria bacterium]
MSVIDVLLQHKKAGELFYDKSRMEYGFNYTRECDPISLTMPYQKSSYIWKHHLHPIFEMNLPEGYLFEVFKNHLQKEFGYIDEFLIFSFIAPNIESRLNFKSEFDKTAFAAVDLNEVLQNDTEDTFLRLVRVFLSRNAVSGIQPKTLALIKDKENLPLKEYIIKTWGEEYPRLAENEYFCMQAVSKAGVMIPVVRMSEHKKFLLVEKFDFNKKSGEFRGFEELLVLMGKNRNRKYSGSYEQVAKFVYAVSTDKIFSMEQLFKTIVMCYLLRNGDAHLKNFGVLYDSSFTDIRLAPAYDIVTTTAYIFNDKPALTMFGKKVWWGKADLIRFGTEHCYLSPRQAASMYALCLQAVSDTLAELKNYMKLAPDFVPVATRILDSWQSSLSGKSQKELSNEIIRNWRADKKA